MRYLVATIAAILFLIAFNALVSCLAVMSIHGLFRWPPRYNIRGLLIVMTVAAFMLGLIGVMIRFS
jgi:hypothetical protein